MISTTQLSNKLKEYLILELDLMSNNAPLIKLMKPLITRALDKNLNKITSALDLIADEDGTIDAEGIVNEMIENITNSEPFDVNLPMLGKVNIGNGTIKFNLPFTDNQLMLNQQDFVTLQEMLME